MDRGMSSMASKPPGLPSFAASVLQVIDISGEDDSVEDDDEVSRYFADPIVRSEEDANPLRWWKNNSARYPKLSLIAKDFLSIPASTVASEAAFSQSGRVITDYRSNLSPDSVSILMELKSWMDLYVKFQWKIPSVLMKGK